MIKGLRNDVKRARRRSYGITAYTGANGGGKTAAMVWDALPSLEAGRPILSTVRILDYENPRECDDPECAANPDRLGHIMRVPTEEGRKAEVRNQRALFFHGPYARLEPVEMRDVGVHQAAHPLWIPWTNWQQLLDFNFGEVLADEMTGIAESRQAASLPTMVLNHLQQLRRADIPFRYTCPAWERADLSLRQPTQSVTVCRGFLKREAPMHGDQARLWRAARLFKWRTYDAQGLTELTEGKRGELTPEVSDWHWGPGSPAWSAYDTFAPVLQVGTVSESGRCHRCGGTRKAPVCSCEPSHGHLGSRPAPVPASDAKRGTGPGMVSPGGGRRVLTLADG